MDIQGIRSGEMRVGGRQTAMRGAMPRCLSLKCLLFFGSSASCSLCSVAQSCPTLCDPMDCSTPDFPVLHYLPEFAQTHVHCVDDAIQPSHVLSPPSFFAFTLSASGDLHLAKSQLNSMQMAEFSLSAAPSSLVISPIVSNCLVLPQTPSVFLARSLDSLPLLSILQFGDYLQAQSSVMVRLILSVFCFSQ